MEITLVAVDLAKRVFQVHGVDKHGKPKIRKAIKRDKFFEFIANLPVCTIAMEACGSAHYWANRFMKQGHAVKLVSPQRAKQFLNHSSKDDAADAESICDAALNPNTRFVPVKQLWQQDTLFVHRIRQRKVENRTALLNEFRSFLYECGIAIPQGPKALKEAVATVLSDAVEDRVPPLLREEFRYFLDELRLVEAEIERLNRKIEVIARENELCQRVEKIPGIGVITATAIVAAAGDVSVFKNGRQFAAWLGLVPGHTGTGGKITMLPITKRGDRYIRGLLVHGGRSLVPRSKRHTDHVSLWIQELLKSKHTNKVAVAIANKNARIVWAILAGKKAYDSNHRKNAA